VGRPSSFEGTVPLAKNIKEGAASTYSVWVLFIIAATASARIGENAARNQKM
jgi:hypothetical protein